MYIGFVIVKPTNFGYVLVFYQTKLEYVRIIFRWLLDQTRSVISDVNSIYAVIFLKSSQIFVQILEALPY